MSPMNLVDYHPDWKSVSRQIREQAGNRCEFCGAPNGELIQRNVKGEWMLMHELDRMHSDAGWYWIGTDDPPPEVVIVLTVAHLCHESACIDPTHLRALCQRCHLNLDRPRHIEKARETRRRQRNSAILATGQGALL